MKSLAALCVIICCILWCAPSIAQNPPATVRTPSASTKNTAADVSEGVRLFHTHCGRCHNPPTDVSPREARAVVRQMRVRAMLSDQDERALLKLLAP
jgi:cytochrome c5